MGTNDKRKKKGLDSEDVRKASRGLVSILKSVLHYFELISLIAGGCRRTIRAARGDKEINNNNGERVRK